jgi:G:T/U-mismatch repair DNA glycosylase
VAPIPPEDWEKGLVNEVAAPDLRVLFVGINPGRHSAGLGHHFAGPQNHFWRLLADSGLTPRLLRPEEDALLPGMGIGITNVIARASRGEGDLSWEEFEAGGRDLRARVALWRPRVVACLGKNVARAYAGLGHSAAIAWGPLAAQGLPAPAFAAPNPSSRSTVPYAERLRLFRNLAAMAAGRNGGADG